MSRTSGHFFITKGDLTTLDCDALLLPTDVAMFVTRLWSGLVGRLPDDEGPLRDFASPPGWGDSVHTCLYSNPAGRAPAVWLSNECSWFWIQWTRSTVPVGDRGGSARGGKQVRLLPALLPARVPGPDAKHRRPVTCGVQWS